MRAPSPPRFGRAAALGLVGAIGAVASLALATAGCGDDSVDPTFLTLVDASRPVFGQPPSDAGADAPDGD